MLPQGAAVRVVLPNGAERLVGDAAAPPGSTAVLRVVDTALFATVCESCGQDFVPLVTGGSGELRLQAQGPTEVLSMSLQERLPLLAYPYP